MIMDDDEDDNDDDDDNDHDNKYNEYNEDFGFGRCSACPAHTGRMCPHKVKFFPFSPKLVLDTSSFVKTQRHIDTQSSGANITFRH